MTHEIYSLLSRLEEARIHFVLMRTRPEVITIAVAVPGQRWEIDVFQDGTVEVEQFTSQGVKEAGGTIEHLLSEFGEPASQTSTVPGR